MNKEVSIPKGWVEVSLKEILLELRNGTTAKQNKEGKGIPVTRIESIQNGNIERDRLGYIENTDKLNMFYYQNGDIAFSHINSLKHVGKVALITISELPLLAGMNLLRLRPSSQLDFQWLYFVLSSPKTRSDVRWKIKKAVNQVSINQKELGKIQLKLPPTFEQKRIADKIEALQAKSNKAKQALGTAKPLLDKLRQSILAAAFCGDLTADWRKKNPDAEPASILLERIRKERRKRWEETELAKMKAKGKEPENDKWKAKYKEPEPVDPTGLPELPKGWCWARLEEISLLKGGLTKGKKRKGTERLTPVSYLRVANVQRGYLNLKDLSMIEATEAEIAELQLHLGDILFNEGGDRDKLGRGWVWKNEEDVCIHQNHVFRARLVSNKTNSEIISHFGNSFGQQWFMKEGKQSTNLASLNMTKLSKFPVPVMPYEESQQFSIKIENCLKKLSFLQEITENTSQQLECLDQSILTKAFQGELVPQDPTDEPASVLLDRIKAEREAMQPKKKATRKLKTKAV